MRTERDRLLDDIDLIALGHMPGGAARAHSRPVRNLDLTAEPRDGWGTLAVREVSRMVPGESIVLVTPSTPYAALDAVYAVAGDACMIEYLATGPEVWVTALTRIG